MIFNTQLDTVSLPLKTQKHFYVFSGDKTSIGDVL